MSYAFKNFLEILKSDFSVVFSNLLFYFTVSNLFSTLFFFFDLEIQYDVNFLVLFKNNLNVNFLNFKLLANIKLFDIVRIEWKIT